MILRELFTADFRIAIDGGGLLLVSRHFDTLWRNLDLVRKYLKTPTSSTCGGKQLILVESFRRAGPQSPYLGVGLAVPINQRDGVYAVSRSPTGQEIHTSLAPSPSRRATPPINNGITGFGDIVRRLQWGRVHCMCGLVFDPTDTDAAVNDLKRKLGTDGQTMRPREAYYSIKGSVVAYVCNLDGNAPLRAWEDVVSESTRFISISCGNYVAGDTGFTTGIAVGYMKYHDGAQFCDESLAAGADRCNSG